MAGIIIGFVAGTWLGTGMTTLYAKFFSFPFLVFSRNPAVYAIAGGRDLWPRWLGAVKAVRGRRLAVAGRRHVARPPRSATARSWAASSICPRFVRQSSVIVDAPPHALAAAHRRAASSAWRWPSPMLVGSLWSFGSIDHMIDVTFHRSDRQDATITFTAAKS